VAFGVIEILMGCAFLLMILSSAFVFLGPATAKMPSGAMPTGPMSPRVIMILVGLQYGLLAAIFITAGIGSIRCKNWARILMLVVSGLWLVCGLFGTLMMAFIFPTIMRQQPRHVAPGIQHAIMAGMIVFMTLLMVLLPAMFLFFYSRKSVRATCLGQKGAQVKTSVGGGTSAPGLPVPLVILGAWQALGAFSLFAIMFMRVTLVFGVILHGAAAILVLLTYSVLSGYAAWAIFQQKLIGWKIALFFAGFGAINMLVSYVRYPELLQLFREAGYTDQTLRIYEQFPQLLSVFWVGMIVVMTALIILLLYTRKFFPTEEQA
jgi:hypothetical protein